MAVAGQGSEPPVPAWPRWSPPVCDAQKPRAARAAAPPPVLGWTPRQTLSVTTRSLSHRKVSGSWGRFPGVVSVFPVSYLSLWSDPGCSGMLGAGRFGSECGCVALTLLGPCPCCLEFHRVTGPPSIHPVLRDGMRVVFSLGQVEPVLPRGPGVRCMHGTAPHGGRSLPLCPAGRLATRVPWGRWATASPWWL